MGAMLVNPEFLRVRDVVNRYGISRSTVFRWVEQGKLPEPTRLSVRVVGWSRESLDEIFLK